MAKPSEAGASSAPSASQATKGQRIWDRIEALVRTIARAEIAAALGNLRPGGAASIALSAGGSGSPIVASALTPCVFARVDFPVELDQLHLIADVAGSITFDLWVQRAALGQVAAAAASIVAGSYPALVAEQELVIDLATAGWATLHLEAGSVLSLYVTAADGVIQTAGFNLRGRCS